jgi:acyl-homoserine lactone acylase PvdQ
VNVANTYALEDEYINSHAPAARMVMSVDGDCFESYAILPGGQSERFDSEHFDDQLGKYLSGDYIPVLYKLDEIIPATVERIKFVPWN